MNKNHIKSSGSCHVLGVDIGSVSVGMVILSADKEVVKDFYEFHHGNVAETVEKMLEQVDLSTVGAVAVTDQTPRIIKADYRCDDQIAVIEAARHFNSKIGSVLNVGGEKFAVLFFDHKGEYSGLKTNTSCAAGTGSFLDQQAVRLNLSGIARLAKIAAGNSGQLPRIASRCAVFAKTDLTHAQQEGYSLSEICDGLCHGLAVNIANTVFSNKKPNTPIVMCGGVARNSAVVEHIGSIVGTRLVKDEMAHLYGAFGTAARMLDEQGPPVRGFTSKQNILNKIDFKKKHGHPPLELVKSGYPDFDANESYEYQAGNSNISGKVEVDIYQTLEPGKKYTLYLGIDIGSISTKAVWMTPDNQVLAGFYTRTSGRPVQAMRCLLESMDNLAQDLSVELHVKGAGTTGSGRKFLGAIAGADLILDEITAHARAAYELNPDVDTIIEIGGQDSKFTTMNNGMVTFSVMNTICAAGTGSFIEEQAEKLGVDLSVYAARAKGVSSPITSDRCTVFMERDINYYLSLGYSVNEVLAAALHSIRENYLNKVAVESSIGQVVCFQGATAKNKALVAAFEQRLNRPIHVSRYCHLTGALGVALHLADEKVEHSCFRGLDLYKTEIPIHSEVCGLCPNHCKITVARMQDGPVAYGFLCGRDYETRHFVDNNKSGFDLVRSHQKHFSARNQVVDKNRVTVGIPASLYLYEDISMWVDFFNQLGMRTITADKDENPVGLGKEMAGAEFCAPITAMHGHAASLADKADFIFLPHYLENSNTQGSGRRQFCYYSQYVPTLVAGMNDKIAGKLISPVIRYLYSSLYQRLEIYRAVSKMDQTLSFIEVYRAFEDARANKVMARKQWKSIFEAQFAKADDISVMLLGRPYTVLDPLMNKKIPGIFATLGIKAFFQDMMTYEESSSITPFLSELHWNYAADIMKAAEMVSRTPGLYPVLMTSFSCSPDSFIREAFQNLMEDARKPYLVLEVDAHGSSVGYETRIEAAVRSFQNHATLKKDALPYVNHINPVKAPFMRGKTVVFPNWDPLTCCLLVANLKHEGIHAELMKESSDVIKRSMRLNSGQCIPINIIAQEFVEHIRNNDLNPEQTVLWMGHAEIACNIRLYPYKLSQMIASFGDDMKKAEVYTGNASFADVSLKAAMNSYLAFMFGGMLRKMGCRVRPYEKNTGETDKVIDYCLGVLEDTFLNGFDKEEAVKEVVEMFLNIETIPRKCKKVAIFGDLYVRDNPVFNKDLISFIESYDAEVITTPYTDYLKMIAPAYFKKWFTEGKYINLLFSRTFLTTMVHLEKKYYQYFQKVLENPEHVYDDDLSTILSEFNIIQENTGESMDNILKIHYIKKYYPDVSLLVQASPSFCCPSLVTEAMSGTIEERTGIPIVSITYDGTGGDKDRKIIPYLML
jgi:predicted CoA-substrate-specific enzyme activase